VSESLSKGTSVPYIALWQPCSPCCVCWRAVHWSRHVIMLRYIGCRLSELLRSGQECRLADRRSHVIVRSTVISNEGAWGVCPHDKVCRVCGCGLSRLHPPRASVICLLILIACFSAAGGEEDGSRMCVLHHQICELPSDELARKKARRGSLQLQLQPAGTAAATTAC
jgi:hypothetical protein